MLRFTVLKEQHLEKNENNNNSTQKRKTFRKHNHHASVNISKREARHARFKMVAEKHSHDIQTKIHKSKHHARYARLRVNNALEECDDWRKEKLKEENEILRRRQHFVQTQNLLEQSEFTRGGIDLHSALKHLKFNQSKALKARRPDATVKNAHFDLKKNNNGNNMAPERPNKFSTSQRPKTTPNIFTTKHVRYNNTSYTKA